MATLHEQSVSIPLSSYTASVTGRNERSEGARGLFVVVRVKTAGTGTITPFLTLLEPFQSVPSQQSQNVNISTAGTFFLVIHPFAAKRPAGEAANTVHANCIQTVDTLPPDRFRFNVNKSDGSTWEFGVSFQRLF